MKSTRSTMLFIISLISINVMAQSKQNENLEEAKKAIAKSNAIYRSLFLKNDGSILTCYTDDACVLPPNSPAVCGSKAIGSFFKGAYNAGVRGGKFIQLSVYGEGKEFVAEEGLWQALNDKDEVVDEGKYLVLWKKTKDGWKMFRDMFSGNH